MVGILKQFYQRNFSDPQASFLAIMIVVGFSVVILMGKMLLPVIAGIVIAYLLNDVVHLLFRCSIPRPYAVWIVFLLFIALLFVIIFALTPLLSEQLTRLVGELPLMLAQGQKLLLTLPDQYPLVTEDQVDELIATIQRQINDLGKNLIKISLAQLPGVITAAVYLVLMPLLVLFFLKDRTAILNWLGQFLPRERSLMSGVWREMDGKIGNYVRGKVWEMLIVGVASSLVFAVMGLNYAILLGALVGISVFVPYIGATVVTIPVLFIAYFQWGTSPSFIYLMIAYGIIQTLDATVLVPVLFSEVVNLHPIAIIVAILVFGGIWGFWGVFFAIPLASFVQVLITAWPSNSPAVQQSSA
jgi:putative permease